MYVSTTSISHIIKQNKFLKYTHDPKKTKTLSSFYSKENYNYLGDKTPK